MTAEVRYISFWAFFLKMTSIMPKKTSNLLLGVLLIFVASICLKWGKNLRKITTITQELCLTAMNYDAHISQISQALYCGKYTTMDPHFDFKNLLAHMGLVHILVASGLHVNIALKSARILPQRFIHPAQMILLALMLIFSGLATPIVRAAIQTVLIFISRRLSLGLGHFRRVSFANVIFLMFFPGDIFSMSFQLSATASYCIAFLKRYPLLLNLSIFVLMYPLLLKFQGQQLIFVINNIFLAPFLGPFLMFTSFASSLIQPFAGILDQPWQIFHILLEDSPASMKTQSLSTYAYSLKKWAQLSYFISLVLCFEFCEMLKAFIVQKNLRSPSK